MTTLATVCRCEQGYFCTVGPKQVSLILHFIAEHSQLTALLEYLFVVIERATKCETAGLWVVAVGGGETRLFQQGFLRMAVNGNINVVLAREPIGCIHLCIM
jgi:hypothetical protein